MTIRASAGLYSLDRTTVLSWLTKRTWRPELASEQTREKINFAARLDCPARDNCMPMQVPAGAEGPGASAAEGRAASGRCGLRTSIPSPDGPDRVLRRGCPSLSESCMRDAARAALAPGAPPK